MLKLLGSACILAGGVLARYLHGLECRRELDTLSDLLSALRRMAEEIRMARTVLPVLLDRLPAHCGPEAGVFFHAAAEAARRGDALEEAWRRGAAALPVPAAGRAALEELGASLGGDEESICKAISLAVCVLERETEALIRRRPEEAKRATALCMSAAALLVILLI